MYTKQSWADGKTGGTPFSAARAAVMEQGIADANTQVLIPTGVKTGAYTAAVGDLVPCDTTTAAFTVTLPTAPANLTRVAVKLVTQSGTNAVTLARGGTDVFNKTGGSTTMTISTLNQLVEVQYASGVWYVVNDSLSLASLQALFVSIAAFLDLSAVSVTSAASGVGLGDKLSMFGSPNPIGFGVQTNRMVAYVPSTMAMAVRAVPGSGQRSSGTDAVVLYANGHMAAPGGSAPTAAGNAGTTPPAPSVSGNDARGTIGFGSGTVPAAGAVFTVTFAAAYEAVPNVQLTARNATTQSLGLYVSAVSTTAFTVSSVTAVAASQANTVYSVAYQVLG